MIPIKPISFAHLPTPIHRLERISQQWGGDIWIKRDDMTESGMSGNKVRKLEYLIADALAKGADTLISCGGIQSNHCRATALASAKFGLGCRLLLRGTPPDGLDGNLLLDRIAGAEVEFISEERYRNNLDVELDRIQEEIRKKGRVPYIIHEGGSDPVGVAGFVAALREARSQCEELGLKPSRIVCAAGSGGTHAGLLIGTRLENWDVEVDSVAVCYEPDETTRRIHRIIVEGKGLFGDCVDCSVDSIRIISGYRGAGYALADDAVYDVIIEAGRLEGLLVDPVYTGKAILAVKTETLAGRMPGLTLFWHTGGVFGLFPFREQLAQALS